MMKIAKRKQPCSHCDRYDARALTVDAVVIKENKVLLL